MKTELKKALALMQFNGEKFTIIYDEENEDNDRAFVGENATEEDEEVEPIEDDEERDNYLVLTDEEANEKCMQYIEESLWAFNAEFIIDQCGLDYTGADSLRKMQSETCDGANDFIRSLIDRCTDIESFVEAAISADGRGHFMNSYDGRENEETIDGETFYIYRMN